jgi:hypothetical protein
MRTLLLLCLAGLCLPLAAGEMYKWTDEKGRVHYSDKPPPEGVKAESRELPKAADSTPPPTSEALAPPSAACLQAQNSLNTLMQNSNVAMDLNGDGDAEKLDEATRQAQIASMRRSMEQLCAPSRRRPPPAEGGAPPRQPPVPANR